MKKYVSRCARCILALSLTAVLLFTGCTLPTLPHEWQKYLDFKFTDYIQMKDGVLWGIPCAYTRVSSDYGNRVHPVTGKWKLHKGIDLAAPEGTPIYASRTGVVYYAGWDTTGGGNIVTIDHQDGYRTQYMHMKEFVVEKGQEVEMGQLIGYVGKTGTATGFHLHFTIRKWNEETESWDWVNPNDYLDFH